MKTGDQFSMSFEEFKASGLCDLFMQANARGWTSDQLNRAFDAANVYAGGLLEGEVPLEMFLNAVLGGEFDMYLFEGENSRN